MPDNKRPNIIFIMADDHAAKAIGAYGHGINQTPHIDRLAHEGARLRHCYVSNSICTPSRAAILTGTYNHVNGVMTLDDAMNSRLPNVAKHLRTGGYQTAMFGKWHLGEGPDHEPTGFDDWAVLPGQGDYMDPLFHHPDGMRRIPGYVTDIITNQCLDWLEARDRERPFFLMCHHKAPHRPWEPNPKHLGLYKDRIALPNTFDDDYKNRARAASHARMRIVEDMTFTDLGLVEPVRGNEAGALWFGTTDQHRLPRVINAASPPLVDKDTGEVFRFGSQREYEEFRYQRYMQRYLRTVASIDESVGRLLDYLDARGLAQDTLVIYTSDQGFFLGEHGWYDKRFMYEESFQMPFLARFPREIPAGIVVDDIASNVDFAPTFLDVAGLTVPSYMQGRGLRDLLRGNAPADWEQLAYHRYWMHRDMHHNAYAHYGVRDQRYKLIYWYNQGLGLPGTLPGGEAPEWEFFDCERDPLELFNAFEVLEYRERVQGLIRKLENKMREIGDEPLHAVGAVQ